MVDYSIIIPAYNEESYLPNTLTFLKKSMAEIDERGEIIVVDNNSTDKTSSVAKKYGTKVVREEINQISRARNRGVLNAQGKQLIFLDADTVITTQLLKNSLEILKCDSVIGGGSTIRFDSKIPPLAAITVYLWNHFSTFMKYPAGCFLFCKRDIYEKAGGFNEKIYASEEIWFARKLKTLGRPLKKSLVILNGNPAITSARKFRWFPMWKLVLTILFFLFMPITIRMKSFCSIWYNRPSSNNKENLNHA